MTSVHRSGLAIAIACAAVAVGASGCGNWRGLNSYPMPGTAGRSSDAFEIQAQLPDVSNIQPNSRVRVGDVAVGNVTKIERQGWHALVTMKINGDVELPENAVATIGQTSLLGSLHVELESPKGVAPEGRLHNGSLIPLSAGRAYPNTEQTLAAVSLVLNGGGIGQLQDVTQALSTAFAGHQGELRSLIEQLDQFITRIDAQKDDIIAASNSLNNVVGKFADQKPVVDRAIKTIPEALAVLRNQKDNLTGALTELGKFSNVTSNSVNQTKAALVSELTDIGPVIESLANAGPDLTRSLSFLSTFPWPKETIANWIRGDYANLTGVFDLTLSRLDSGFMTGTRWQGNLTELEMQWGRTIGQKPSPYTASNPLIVPYVADQGP